MFGRKLISLVTAAILLLSFTGCGKQDKDADKVPAQEQTSTVENKDSSTKAENIELRMAWWGSNTRHEKFNKILDMYEAQNPNVKVIREYAGWADYWSKLATQAAGGNVPDIPGFVMMTIEEYAKKGVTMPLDDYVTSGKINLSDWSKAIIDSGRVDGKLHMISAGVTAASVFVNVDMIKRVGMESPKFDMDLKEFSDYCKELQKKLPPNTYAVSDAGRWDLSFESFLRQKGKEISSDGGKTLGFTKEDFIEYQKYWDDLRKAGATPPAQMTAETADLPVETQPLVKGQVAIHFMNSNQLIGYQQQTQDKLSLIRIPGMADGKSVHGEALQPSSLAISNNSKYKDEAAALINWFVNDIEAAKIFNTEWGVIAPKHVQDVMVPTLDPVNKIIFDHMNEVTKDIPATIPRAEGSSAIISAFTRSYETIAFDKKTIEQAADEFFAEAEKLLKK